MDRTATVGTGDPVKKIDLAFGMRVLERMLNKPESQIRREAAEDKEEWPLGEDELGSSLHTQKIFAEAIVKVLGTVSDRVVTPDVYRAIRESAGYPIGESSRITEGELHTMQRRVDIVFELYEEPGDGYQDS